MIDICVIFVAREVEASLGKTAGFFLFSNFDEMSHFVTNFRIIKRESLGEKWLILWSFQI